ncbi:MAG: enoyl-CoA hydratase-related protein, partial [Myxococcota bacterium]
MEPEFLRVDIKDHVATVMLDRPPVNAVNGQAMEEIRETFPAIGADRRVRAVVFGSACERAFCGGVDLKGRAASEEPSGSAPPPPTDPGARTRSAFWAVLDCPVPVIAAVNGPALGAGLGLVA